MSDTSWMGGYKNHTYRPPTQQNTSPYGNFRGGISSFPIFGDLFSGMFGNLFDSTDHPLLSKWWSHDNENNNGMSNVAIPAAGSTLSDLFYPKQQQSYLGYDDAIFDGEEDDNWWTYYNDYR